MRLAVVQPFLFSHVPHPRVVPTTIEIREPFGVGDSCCYAGRFVIGKRAENQVAGTEIGRVIEVVHVHLRHHLLHEESRLNGELLHFCEHTFRPLQFIIIGDNDEPLTSVADRFHASLHEDTDALTFIARTPRRVCIKAIEVGRSRKAVEAVVED